MEPVYRFPTSPGTPLFPISPERANRQQMHNSPPVPTAFSHLHNDPFASQRSSLVQGKVAQFNEIAQRARRRDNEAALERAVLGREEAESETRRLRERTEFYGKKQKKGVPESEELSRNKETQAHSKTIYEKEVRRARKEAFKSSSALVSLQEEFKVTRNKFTLMREDVEEQKRKIGVSEHEAFAAQYKLASLQEDFEIVKQQLKVAEEERDALKTSLKEEEVARIAAEGRIALPECPEDVEFASPKRLSVAHRRDSAKENVEPNLESERAEALAMSQLRDELQKEKKWRLRAHDMIDFLKLECRFQRCSCRLAENKTETTQQCAASTATSTEQPKDQAIERNGHAHTPSPTATAEVEPQFSQEEALIEFSPTTGTFRTVPSPKKAVSNDLLSSPQPSTLLEEEPKLDPSVPIHHIMQHTPTSIETVLKTPQPVFAVPPPRPQTLRIVSTTTTIPLADPISPVSNSHANFPYSPASTMTREEALEQIRQRRGRARSIAAAGTPRKVQSVPGLIKRDISAPTGNGMRLLSLSQ